ncbi:Ig-like domain-containing protein [Enterobacter bugandensis]|uniref:Ig-like domain-containing protein n=1 Tax=Enterobacter bugandensis TaxID=881260 RepID=UPI002158166C|nr:Ig-like domain-containing protein [Enterobacter bugandensis]MCR6709439.1 Ig-like domain-containing protein [Enterobacter bugandensis]
MAGMWGSAQQNGAGDALRGAANSEVNAALTQEVEAWLNNIGGKARVTADVGIGGSDSRDFGLDYLWPVKIWQHDILFTQMSAHRWNERDILNVGLGWRHTFNPHLMAGGNLFFDQDVTRHHNRMGAGAELWSDGIRASANYYLPLSGWRHSDDSMFNDDPDRYELYERAARGWDLNLETALSQHVALKLGWFQWYGDKVDVNGSRSEASHNPHGLNLGLKWQPVPLVGVSAEQSMISGQRDNFSVGLNFHWEFGRKLSEMLASENASALPSLMQSRTEFVTRNNNIVLAYKQEEKDRRLYFSPTEKTTQAGVPLLHAVKGGQGGVIRYTSSSTAIATVEPGSGLVNPTHRGDVTITATETSPVDPEHVLSSASYHLTVTPGDFAPSVEGVAIKGDMSPGQILEGSYLYKSNEGEDEDPEKTRLRWYDAVSGETLKEGSATYEVQTRDMARSVVFEVTPFNKKGIAGNSGSANVNGSAKLGALHVGLMTPGEVRPDGSVKFYVQSNGALQLLTEVKNDKEEAVEGLTVYWTSQNALGHLSQHVTHTDPKGQTSVSVEEIMSSGQDQITASLSPLVAGYSGNVTEDNGRYSHMKLNVNFAKADRLTFIQPPEHAMVGAAQPFTVKLTDQDGEDFKTSVDIAWQSNGQPIDQLSHTNDRGEASITLTAPTLVGTDWEVTATVEGGNPVTVKIPMVADVATAKVSALEVIDNSAAADGTDTTRVRVTVKDAHENPVAGQAVNFRSGEGVVLPATATTEKDGTVTVSQTSLKAGEFRVEATTGDNWTQAKSGLVTFTADSSTAKVSALEVIDNSAVADGTDTTRVRVTVKDAHENPVAGQAVSFDAGTGVIIPATAETGKDGTVTVSQTSQKAGEFQVNATIGDNWLHAKSGLVTFTADSSTANVSALEVIDNSAVADGTDTTRVRVTVKDAHENPVAGQAVSFDAGTGVIIPATATTEKDGTVTVSQTSLKAGEFQVNATIGDNWLHAKSGLVTFTADSSTAKVSALEVIDNSAVADGTDTTRVRVTVKDAHENPVAGQVVNFRAGEGVVLPATATTEKDGTVTVSQTSLKAGEFRVEATTGDNWTQAKSGLVTFTADSSTAKVSALEVIDNSAVADGTDTTRVRVTVKDAHENPVAGQAVNFRSGEGVVLPATATTEKDGTVTVSQTSLKAGEFRVEATTGDNWTQAKSGLVTFTADSSTAKVSALEVIDNSAVADGTDTTRVRVTVKDAHENPVAGQAVSFDAGTGVIIPATAETGKDGTVTVSQTSQKAGEFQVNATIGDNWLHAKSGLVTFTADSSTANVSALEVIDNSAVADGTDTTRVRVTVKDAHENPVAGQAVSFDAGTGVIIPATATTEKDGTVTVSQTSLKAGEFQVNATIGDNWLHAKSGLVTFTADSSTAKVSALEVIDNSAVADGTDTTRVRVTVKDAHENPVAGQVVNFRAGEGVVLPATATTEKDGTVTVSQTSLKAGEFRVEATTGDNWTQAKSGLVTFTADSSTAKVSALEVIDNSAVADGTDTTRVRVTVKDAHENPVAGQAVSFDAGTGVIIPATAETGKDGTVTVSQTSQKAGEFQVSATIGDNWLHAKSGLVNFVPGKVNRVTFVDEPKSVQADGVTHATWQIAMFDSFNNPVPNTAVNWIFPGALATKIDSQSDTMTNNSGVAKLTLQMGTVKAENLVVTAKSENNIEDSSSIALPPVAGSVELTMASTARVDEPVTLTVTAKDKGGVLMPGAVVTFSSNHPDWMVITPESATTGSNGVATAVATIRPEKGLGAMGGYTLTAKVSESVKDSQTLQLSVGQIDYAKSSLTPVSDTMVVGNQLSMLIAMKDKFGNPVSGLTGRIGAVLADSQGRNNGGLIHTNSGGITETEKGNYPFNVKGTRADTYTVTPIVDRVELSALKATVKVTAQKPWIAGTPQIGYTLTIGKGSGFSTATVNWKVNGTIYRSSANTSVDNASLELTDTTLINQKVSVEIIDSHNSSLRLESDSVTIRGTPSASDVKIKGDPVYGNQISVDYVYQANGGGDESGTQYQWYWSQNSYDKSPTPIPGATGRTLKTDRGQYGLYLYVSVTPRGSAGGSGAKVFNDGYFRVTDAGTPSVSQLHIVNEARVGNTIEASYIFNANGSGEDNSLYQWASWDEFSGHYRNLDGETGKTLYIKEAYGFLKDIRVSVTPRGTLGSQRTGGTAYSDPVNIVK